MYALVALRDTTFNDRRHGHGPSWVFGVAVASLDSTALAAASPGAKGLQSRYRPGSWQAADVVGPTVR